MLHRITNPLAVVLFVVRALQVVEPFPIVASKLSEVFVRLDWQGEEQDVRCVPVHRRGR
jgi:hypothetical protein